MTKAKSIFFLRSDAIVVELWVGYGHALIAIRFLLQVNPVSAETTACPWLTRAFEFCDPWASFAVEPSLHFHNVTVNGTVRNAGEFEVLKDILLCPE